ncbi:MAG: glycosyltransferase family 4 protein [Steroidobacteraceae bacterium]
MTALRICLISQEFPPYTNWGGIAVYNGMLAHELAQHGHEVVVISRVQGNAPARELIEERVCVLRVGTPIWRKILVGRTVDRMLQAHAVAAAVRPLHAQKRFDIFETTEASFEGEQLQRDGALRPHFIIQCNGSNAFGQAAGGLLAPLHRIDWAWSFRHEQLALRRAGHIVVTSNATREVILRQGIAAAKVRLIYQGIDTRQFRPAEAHGIDPTLQVGFVGRLESRKGIDFIWRVVETIGPDNGVHFHLRGAVHPANASDTRARLRRYARWVTHHAPCGHDEMPGFYRSLHVLLQPSRFENFGLAYAEAMASGLLVIAGVGGSAREVVHDGVTGLLVDPDGTTDVAVDAIRKLVRDRGSFDAMRAAARRDVEQRFSLESCIKAKVALYDEVAGK